MTAYQVHALFKNEPSIMHCAKCQATVDLPASGAAPMSCPICGAPPQADSPAPARRPESVARRGSILWIVIVSILIVGLAAVSVASTIYAMRTVEDRDRAKEDLAQTSKTVDELVVAVASNSKLKGATADEARQEILQPAVDHYSRIIEKYQGDEEMSPAVASAQLRMAALQAKLDVPECVQSLGAGLGTINQMLKGDFDEESFPSFQESVQIAEPTDWVTVKGSTPMQQGVALYSSTRAGISAYRDLSTKFPKSIVFRNDLVTLLKSSAMLTTFAGRPENSLPSWVEASQVLETLVRDEPDNADFQERLVESLVSAAKIENSSGEKDKAIANYMRAVEVRQKMVDANPEDKALAKALNRVQRDLEGAETAPASEKDAPKEEKPADEAPKKEAPEKQPAKDDPSQEPTVKKEPPKPKAEASKDDARPE